MRPPSLTLPPPPPNTHSLRSPSLLAAAVQANNEANTYVVSGSAEERKAAPGMSDFAKLAKQLGGRIPPGFSAQDLLRMQQAVAAGGVGGADEDMPDLEGVSFDAAADKGEAEEEMPSLESK